MASFSTFVRRLNSQSTLVWVAVLLLQLFILKNPLSFVSNSRRSVHVPKFVLLHKSLLKAEGKEIRESRKICRGRTTYAPVKNSWDGQSGWKVRGHILPSLIALQACWWCFLRSFNPADTPFKFSTINQCENIFMTLFCVKLFNTYAMKIIQRFDRLAKNSDGQLIEEERKRTWFWRFKGLESWVLALQLFFFCVPFQRKKKVKVFWSARKHSDVSKTTFLSAFFDSGFSVSSLSSFHFKTW